MTDVETVQDIYRAFGDGDIPRILAHLSASVEWEYGVNSTDVPWLQPRRSPSEVANFFAALGGLEVHRFAVKRVVGSDDIVVSVVDFEATVKATGRRILEEDEIHIWYFDSSGKVSRYRHRIDTHQQQLAFKPV